MKTLFLLLSIILISTSVIAADRYWKDVPVTGVVDGDTLKAKFTSLPYPLYNVKIRISGIDAPEKGYTAKCEKEKILGQAATSKLAELVDTSTTMTLKNFKYDKYGGRVNSEVMIKGINLGAKMVELGFAKPYSGTGPKPSWCE